MNVTKDLANYYTGKGKPRLSFTSPDLVHSILSRLPDLVTSLQPYSLCCLGPQTNSHHVEHGNEVLGAALTLQATHVTGRSRVNSFYTAGSITGITTKQVGCVRLPS